MGISTDKFGVADYLAAAPRVGLPRSNFVPVSMQGLCATVAQRNIPVKAPPGFVTLTTACLIARGMIYWKSNPGDCGTATKVDLANAQYVSEAGQVAAGIASMAGASLPGIGIAIEAISEIFAHHAQAVANERKTICSVLGVMNQVIGYYDKQVRVGRISPSTAYAGMQNFIAQVDERLGSIFKTCNSACVWQGVLQAHADFCQSYYPAIAPRGLFSHAPGAAPSLLDSVPGGVILAGGADKVLSKLGIATTGFTETAFIVLVVILAIFAIGWAA